MDGFAMPPVSTAQGPGLIPPPGLPQPNNDGNNMKPVGRPSGDPARDEERLAVQMNRSKLRAVLPRESTDSRVSVYRYRRGSNQRSPRPVMKITISELDEATAGNRDSQEYITSRIREKYESGRFLCVPEDNKGTPIPAFSPWEANLDAAEEDRAMSDDDFEDDFRNTQPRYMANGPQAPIGTPSDPGAVFRDMHEVLAGENERTVSQGKDMMALVMTTMTQAQQSQQTQLMAMMQAMSQAQAQQTQMFVAMMTGGNQQRQADDERRRQEEDRRMERERDRRNDLFKTLTTVLIPVVTPLLAKLTAEKPDMLMPLILDMVKTKDNNSSAKELMSMMNAAAQQQIQLQGEVSRQAMAGAADANKAMMTHVLTLSNEVTRSMLEQAGEPGDDPLDKFAKIMKAISPVLTTAGQPAAPPMSSGPLLAPAAMDAAAALDNPQGVDAPEQAQPAQAAPAAPATDGEKVRACLHTLRRLEQNQIAANERVWALDYCRKAMPPDLLAAVAAGQEDRIMGMCQPVVLSDQTLLQWVQGSGVGDYILDALKDVQRIAQSDVRMKDAERIVAKQVAYLKARNLAPLTSNKAIWSADPAEPPRRRGRLPSEDQPAAVATPAAAEPQKVEPAAPAPEAAPPQE